LFDKVLLGVIAAWLLTVAWFWIVAPTVQGGHAVCPNFPIVRTLRGHPNSFEDPSYQGGALESDCRSAEDHSSLVGFCILGGGIILLVAVAYFSGRFPSRGREQRPAEVGAQQ
jgi:hypothetical protein